MEKEIIKEVIQDLQMTYGEKDDFVYATEYADVHYQIFGKEKDLTLRLISGEDLSSKIFLKRIEVWKKNWKIIVFLLACYPFMVNSLISPLWYFCLLGMLIYILLPLIKHRKVYKRIIPALENKGFKVTYEGCFDAVENEHWIPKKT